MAYESYGMTNRIRVGLGKVDPEICKITKLDADDQLLQLLPNLTTSPISPSKYIFDQIDNLSALSVNLSNVDD